MRNYQSSRQPLWPWWQRLFRSICARATFQRGIRLRQGWCGAGCGRIDRVQRIVLLTRQGQRLDLLETDLRDMRGILETDVRNLKMQITQLGNNASSGETATTAEIRDLRDQIERLADAVAMTSRRMERTLELTSI